LFMCEIRKYFSSNLKGRSGIKESIYSQNIPFASSNGKNNIGEQDFPLDNQIKRCELFSWLDNFSLDSLFTSSKL